MAGVALAAIRAVNDKLLEKDQVIAELQSEVMLMKNQLTEVNDLKEMVMRYLEQAPERELSQVSF